MVAGMKRVIKQAIRIIKTRNHSCIFMLFFLLFCLESRLSLDGYELEFFLSAMNIYHGNGPALAPGFKGCPGIPDTTGTPVFPRQNFLQSYLSVPLYAIGAYFWGEQPTIPGREGTYWDLPWGPLIIVSMLNPLLSAGIVIFVFLLLKYFEPARTSHIRSAVLFGLTTMIWPYAGLGLEVVQTFFLTATVWSILTFQATNRISYIFLSTIYMMVLINCKKSSIIFLIPLSVYLTILIIRRFRLRTSHAIIIFSVFAIIAALFMTITLSIKLSHDPHYWAHIISRVRDTGFPSIDIVFGLTISPSEGLFIFNPLLFFAISGWMVFWKKHRGESILFGSLVIVLMIAIWRLPYLLIDEEWGPRYLHAILPFLWIMGNTGLFRERTGGAKTWFTILLILSIYIQLSGSLFLGFKVMDAVINLPVADYTIATFTPSLSQIYLASYFFKSTIHRYLTGSSLDFTHISFNAYSGLGAIPNVHVLNLKTYDHPVGALFTIRWVLGEMGYHVWPEPLILLTTLSLIGIIIFLLFRLSRPYI